MSNEEATVKILGQHSRESRIHLGGGRTPMTTLRDGKTIWKVKFNLTDTAKKPVAVRLGLKMQ